VNIRPVVIGRSQVVRIFDMFYQPWVRVFVDVRGAQYDSMKPKFTDSRRLFRFAWCVPMACFYYIYVQEQFCLKSDFCCHFHYPWWHSHSRG